MDTNRVAGILLLLFSIATSPTTVAQQAATPSAPRHTSQLNLQWLDAVVSIEQHVVDPSTKTQAWRPIGTGFLVLTKFNHVVLITAKHVVYEAATLRPELGYRLSDRGKDTIVTEAMLQEAGIRDWFTSHSADLALRFFGAPQGTFFPGIPQTSFIDTNTLEPERLSSFLGFLLA